MKKKDKKQEKQIVKSTKIMNVYWFWDVLCLQQNQFWVFFFSARSSTFLTASLLSTFMLSHPSQTVVWIDIDLHHDSRSRKWKTGHLARNQKKQKTKKNYWMLTDDARHENAPPAFH